MNQLPSHDLTDQATQVKQLSGADANLQVSAINVEELIKQNQALQENCQQLTHQLHDVAKNPINWLLLAQAKCFEEPFLFKYPYEKNLISVIIPAYNASNFLADAVLSVWRQQLEEDTQIELLVVDDGSTDDSYEIANMLARVSPISMRVLTHPGRMNRGVAASRNLGIAESKGEWVSLLDADDRFIKNKTQIQVNWLKNNPDYLCVCSYGYNVDYNGKPVVGWNSSNIAGDYQNIALDSRIPEPYTFELLTKGCAIVNSTFIAHRDVLAWVGSFPEYVAHQVEDWILFTRISVKWAIPVIKEPLILYRVHPSSWTTRYFTENLSHGVKLEYLLSVTYWLASRQEFTHLAESFYRKNFPSYFCIPGQITALINEYLLAKSSESQFGSTESQGLSTKNFEEHLVGVYTELHALRNMKKYVDLANKIPGIKALKKLSRLLKLY